MDFSKMHDAQQIENINEYFNTCDLIINYVFGIEKIHLKSLSFLP